MSDHFLLPYDPDIQAQKDYEALNADTRKQLNAAIKRIEKLEITNKKHLATIAGIVVYLKMYGINDRVKFLEDYLSGKEGSDG